MSRKIYIIIAVMLTIVLSVSTFFIIRNHIDSAKQNEVYDNLAEIVEDEPPKENEGVTFSEDKDYLAEYLELYRQNEDMVGWIKVEDTNINYPVVQSVNEPNFYLKHKFDKTYSAYGCPYVQENCDVQKPSDNIITVSYTHLDVYKRQALKLSSFYFYAMEWVSGFISQQERITADERNTVLPNGAMSEPLIKSTDKSRCRCV